MEETIAAISTSTMSNGGISIIRLSGIDAIEIADKIFVSKRNIKLSDVKSHTVHYGNIVEYNETFSKEYSNSRDNNKECNIDNKDTNNRNYKNIIDEVLVIVMKGPNTYTREDIVEIDCHGGILVTKRVLEECIKAGARPAEPGEFTKRAFLNGRIDLSQAEAVIDVINAKNSLALKSSVNQLNGRLSEKIEKIREEIINHIAFIEAALDDPEHISLDNYCEKLQKDVDNYVDNINYLLITYENGRIIHDGINTCLLGKTNAGKSSLLNMLSKSDRAIVTDIEGTTRDILEEQINIGEVTLNLIDTAGIRKTDDVVESIGVDKAIEYANKADLIIYVVDASRPLDENDSRIISLIKDKKVMVLLNKCDMEQIVTKEDIINNVSDKCSIVSISAKQGTGINEVESEIKKMFFSGEISFNDEIYITSARHKNLLSYALKSMMLVKEGIENGMEEDFLTIDLMDSYAKLGLIIGQEVEDDLANQIFSKFCMGK